MTAVDPLLTDADRARAAARAGIRDGLMVMLAYIPFGLAMGAAMASTNVSPFISILSSPVIVAGASQLAAIQLLNAGASVALVVVTVAVINARHLLYSAALEPHLATWSRGTRMAAAFVLSDPMYAMAAARFGRADGGGPEPEKRAYYFGAGISASVGWSVLTAVGVLAGGLIPHWVPLELAIPLTFLLLTLPLIKNSAGLVAAGVGGFAALAASSLPLGVDILVGAATGLLAGGIVLNFTERRQKQEMADV
ncbi:MAG: AzlC family ABC transporter permease [Pseudolysinimonas sp.]